MVNVETSDKKKRLTSQRVCQGCLVFVGSHGPNGA